MLQFVSKCQAWLSENPEVMEYLVELRHMTPNSIKEFQIGYFPRNAWFDPIPGDPPELCQLRGRVIIPILSEFGKIVGIAGRIPDPNEKGWWNTKFVKGSHLYGFNSARKSIFENNKTYVFEGYMDRIILAQYGLTNSVSAMSTNLGMRRIGLISRYCDKVCLCFDTDQNDSGLIGFFKTLADMYSVGIGMDPSSWEITRIKLPVKVDPDDFVAEHGMEAFLSLEKPIPEELLKKAESAHEELKYRLQKKRGNK